MPDDSRKHRAGRSGERADSAHVARIAALATGLLADLNSPERHPAPEPLAELDALLCAQLECGGDEVLEEAVGEALRQGGAPAAQVLMSRLEEQVTRRSLDGANNARSGTLLCVPVIFCRPTQQTTSPDIASALAGEKLDLDGLVNSPQAAALLPAGTQLRVLPHLLEREQQLGFMRFSEIARMHRRLSEATLADHRFGEDILPAGELPRAGLEDDELAVRFVTLFHVGPPDALPFFAPDPAEPESRFEEKMQAWCAQATTVLARATGIDANWLSVERPYPLFDGIRRGLQMHACLSFLMASQRILHPVENDLDTVFALVTAHGEELDEVLEFRVAYFRKDQSIPLGQAVFPRLRWQTVQDALEGELSAMLDRLGVALRIPPSSLMPMDAGTPKVVYAEKQGEETAAEAERPPRPEWEGHTLH